MQDIKPKDCWIITTQGMGGYFAVRMWVNPGDDFGPFAEPYDTGIGRYATREEAIEEAESWAKDAGLDYIPSGAR